MTTALTLRTRLSRALIPNVLLPATALLIVLTLLVARGREDASASSYGHGDCWRLGPPATPWTCPYNYSQFGTAYTWFVSRGGLP